jgi:hypothetical protein
MSDLTDGNYRLAIFLAFVSFGCDPIADSVIDRGLTSEEMGVDGDLIDVGPDPDRGDVPDLAVCDPEPVEYIEGMPTGLASCGEGHFDRVAAVSCRANVAGEDYRPCGPQDTGACQVDDDCGGGNNRCIYYSGECLCQTFCETDSDCGEGEACICRGAVPNRPGGVQTLSEWSVCRATECWSDMDCDGFGCGMRINDCGPAEGFACRTPDDECHTDSECPMGEPCIYAREEGRWICLNEGAACE